MTIIFRNERVTQFLSVTLDWSEAGGPLVAEPTRRGFGSTIIQRSIPHELGGLATLDYSASGFQARFVLPSQHVVMGDDHQPIAIAAPRPEASPRLSGLVLVVEDNVLIALDVEDVLIALGAERVVIASNVTEALRLIDLEIPGLPCLTSTSAGRPVGQSQRACDLSGCITFLPPDMAMASSTPWSIASRRSSPNPTRQARSHWPLAGASRCTDRSMWQYQPTVVTPCRAASVESTAGPPVSAARSAFFSIFSVEIGLSGSDIVPSLAL